MSKPAKLDSTRPQHPVASGWSASRRAWVSLLIGLHLSAIFVAPWTAVEPRSQFGLVLRRFFEPYLQLMYLDHGYRFFAPEPGPSHLVYYQGTQPSGETVEGRIPDPQAIWPRLRYHRWFMLSETINQHAALLLDEEGMNRWKAEVEREAARFEQEGNLRRAAQVRREFREQLRDYDNVQFLLRQVSRNLGQVLLERHGLSAIRLTMVTRLIPTPYDVLDGFHLDDEAFMPDELQVDLGTFGGQGREQLPGEEVKAN